MLPTRMIAMLLIGISLSGCCTQQCIEHSVSPREVHSLGYCDDLLAKIEYPDVQRRGIVDSLASRAPRRLSDGVPDTYWVLTLDEVVRFGMENSDILRDLGGRILDFPSAVTSVFDPSISMSHPRLGEEAALSAFDAQFANQFTTGESSNVFNNATLGGGATEINEDFFRWQTEIQKTSATGAQYSIRNLIEHNNSDAPFNLFPSAWNGSFEAEIRQPLLQGAGVDFNRIAGPSGSVDLSLTRGVVLARIDGDISVAQFEKGVRDYVRQLEAAYWRLYAAYRNLDANRRARDLARDTWQSVKARFDANVQNGEADVEAQAREQLYLFEQLVINALNGTGGQSGIYEAERQLRQLLGLPANDGRLIRPADEPTDAPVRFEWDGSLNDALHRRVELRQQMWRIKQRELELLAARNFLLPRLDAVASYRVAGFGDDLIGGRGPFNSLFREMAPFDNDEVELGFQLNVPIGYRQQFAGVRHAELNLARERAVLKEQEHAISHDLAGAIAGLETTFENIRFAYNRLLAAEDVVAAREVQFEAGRATIQAVLEAQRRLADALTNYYQSRVAHVQAITNVHFEKGTLLAYNGVSLGEGAWCDRACKNHCREDYRHKRIAEDYRISRPILSRGPAPSTISQTREAPITTPAAPRPVYDPALEQQIEPQQLLPPVNVQSSPQDLAPQHIPGTSAPQLLPTQPTFDAPYYDAPLIDAVPTPADRDAAINKPDSQIRSAVVLPAEMAVQRLPIIQ